MSNINYLIAQGPQTPVRWTENYQAGRRNALMDRALEQKMGMESKLFEQGQEDRSREISAQDRQVLQQEVMGAAAGVIMAAPEQRAQAYTAGREYLNKKYPGALDLPEQYDEGQFLGAVAPLFPKEVMQKIVQDRFQPKKYNNPVAGVDAKGNPVFRQFSDDGSSLDVPGFAPGGDAAGLEKVDAGDRIEMYDKSGRLVRTVKKGAAPAEGAKPSDVAGMRKEFTALTKDFQVVQDSYNRIKEVTKNTTAAGDMALLYNYVKLLDPGSVVRESEFATVAASGSYGDRVQAAASRILSGERLSENIRNDFINSAGDLFTAQKNSYKQIKGQYRSLAERAKMNPDDVTPDLETPQVASPAAAVVKTPDGQTFTFPDQQSADAWKKKNGL